MSPRTPEPPDFPASQLFLRRLAFHLVRDEARAEDLVQDTWAAWIEHRPSGVAEPRAWLARVLRNRAFNAKRSDERRARNEELAGRPDPSDPETEGTLEAQAQLLEALRKLEEPYRSTLVQRYYHDLAPKEIAGRSGTPLNTVKARLARGLEKLRGAMDRRYGGDRRAWCHWLTVVGAPPVGVQVPGGTGPALNTGAVAGSSALAWTGVALLVAAGAAAKAFWPNEPRGPAGSPPAPTALSQPRDKTRSTAPPEPERTMEVPREASTEGTEEETLRATVRASRPRPPAAPEPEERVALPPPFLAPFDWPQYAGGPAHDTYRARDDGITRPYVRWFLPGLSGPPSLMDGDLYSGGVLLVRVDPRKGELRGVASPLFPALLRSKKEEVLELAQRMLAEAQGESSREQIGGAPVVTWRSVIVRSLADGAVLAYDRTLENELWRFDLESGKADRPEHARVPLCLAEDGTLIVVAGRRIFALDAASGGELWRFSCNGTIHMVPACAGGRVFFGMDRGELLALSLGTGERLWNASAGTFTTTPPAIVGDNLYVADLGNLPWRLEREDPGSASRAAGNLRLFDGRSGKEVWKLGFKASPLSPLGFVGDGPFAFVGHGERLGRVDLKAGRLPPSGVFSIGGAVVGTPAVVGASLVHAGGDGRLFVRVLDSFEVRWAFQAPEGAKIEDFVHAGEQLYVATSSGLFCLGNGPEGAPFEPGLVLEWEGDTKKPSIDPQRQLRELGYGGD